MSIVSTRATPSSSANNRVKTRSLKDGSIEPASPLGFKYFACSLVLVVTIFLIIDRVVIPLMEDEGKLVSHAWEEENDFLYYSMHARNKSNFKGDAVWRSEGFPVSEKKRKGHRVLVLGDSFAWGHGYANMNDIWWRQLERELHRRGYRDVEVIAAGMQGINTRFELDMARRVIPRYKPDVVVWGLIPNDLDELSRMTPDDLDQKAVFRPHRADRLESALRGLFPDLAYQLFQIRGASMRMARSGDAAKENPPSWEYQLVSGENWQSYRKTIKEVGVFLDSLDVPSFFLALPYECPGSTVDFNAIKAHYDKIFPPVKQEFDRNNVRFVDAFDNWIEAARKERNLFDRGILWFGINPANAHPNTWATRAYAVKAADVLERDYSNCLGEKTSHAPQTGLRINDWLPASMFVQQGGDKVLLGYPFNRPDDFRVMPLRKPYIQLSLEEPITVRKIKLGGETLADAQIFFTHVNSATGVDDGIPVSLGLKRGKWLTWDVPPALQKGVNTVNISATVKGVERALLLEFEQ